MSSMQGQPRSTEQLTRCSTTSLEEGTPSDKVDNVENKQTIPKIMSVCKNTIRWALLIDILIALTALISPFFSFVLCPCVTRHASLSFWIKRMSPQNVSVSMYVKGKRKNNIVRNWEKIITLLSQRRNQYSFLMVLMGLLEFGNIPHNQIGFFCNDPKLSFKFRGDTISVIVLLSVTAFLPIFVMWITEYTCQARNNYDKETESNKSRLKQVWIWYGHYTIGTVTLAVGCNVMKIIIGEPRPHFFDTCQPLEARNCTNEYIKSYTCTNSIDSNWFITDSSKSFPSSHSALSVFTSIFIASYLQERMTNKTLLVKPWLQLLISMWAVICSLSRIADNRHHWWDVLAGLFIGTITAILILIYQCRLFRLDRKTSSKRVKSDFIGNEQVACFDEKNYQSKKKLVNSANNVDIPEGRELRDITVSWKE
ncbi:putative phosphatidate phosphatase isoform X2 [Vespa velutina]|uniref:putative phosphatidate phosphatase isoform X2 n=1 Tax=Vespa velutina TaxID=202808 RepID=UPI001FB50875|nr:putative phosphatidate phosphatase isoform X2 [Vespa velutina]